MQDPKQDAVLVVDDEDSVCRMLKAALGGECYRVGAATNADDAFALLPDLCPRVAVIDIKLPGRDGMEVCRELVSEHGIEVILITGDNERYSYEDAARAGACDFLTKPIRIQELILRVERAVATRRLRIERDETVAKLRRLSVTDGLTGLYNSRHFSEMLRAEIVRADRYGHPVSLLILDLDHFKTVNDRYGHLEGDSALLRTGDVIRDTIRESDSAYRYGGEEFAVLLPETAAGAAMRVAERLRNAITLEWPPSGAADAVTVTASVGIALWQRGEAPQAFLHRADMAMYEAKRNGRNRIEWAPEPGKEGEEPVP
jgi:diguanylate cyclase (GGDEF)-like protein